MSDPVTVWRCKRCGSVVRTAETNIVACPCGCGWGEWDRVEVHPLGTGARLRRLEYLFAQVVEAWESVDGCPRKTMLEICAEALK